MILISHRGNLNGPDKILENSPDYIDNALFNGFDVEIDVWLVNNEIFLGHDKPDYGVDFRWFRDRLSKLWVHCKNIDAILYFKECGYDINFFWHENDTVTLTSKGYIWAYPGKQPIKNSIAVLPELKKDDIRLVKGICSDYILKYK